jgi:4-amino-4-deoxy-L-arabinose transferase-like glycosyltransferase
MKPLIAVFAFGTLVRLAFFFGADQPLLYTHQYTYLTNALRIAEHEHALRWVLTSDEWRVWDEAWTIAPLYFVFLGGLFKLLGAHLVPIHLLQCLMGGATAAGVAALGREMAGRAGLAAGVAYALYAPSVEIASTTMTENLHTPLLVLAALLLARAADRPSARSAFLAGVVVGLSALARSVSTGLLGLGALLPLVRHGRRGLLPAVFTFLGGLAVILPWTARNAFIVGDPVLIESAAFENLWYANTLVDKPRFEKQQSAIRETPDPAERRRMAVHFAWRGVRRDPGAFAAKIPTNFWHFLRPEGLHNLLTIERSQDAWRHVMALLLDDAIFFLALPLFAIFLLASPLTSGRALILLWTAYYLFMIVVVFHNEIRYRSAFAPFLIAGAAAGWVALFDRTRARRRVWIGGLLGLWLLAVLLRPYVAPAWRTLQMTFALRPALAAADAGRTAEALALTESAAARTPRSPRPWTTVGHHLAYADHVEAALTAYDRGHALAAPDNWSARMARPQLLRALGRPEVDAALAAARATSWNVDPWIALETAWRELPAPRGDEIRLGEDDYGAVRGFFHPRGGDTALAARRLEWNRYDWMGHVLPPPGPHRWSRHRAWLRLRPLAAAPRYTATLWMSVAFPSTLTTANVAIRAGGERRQVTVDREIRPYEFAATPDAAGVVQIQIDAPTWCRSGEPAEQGVRVDRLVVRVAGAS